MQDHRKEWETNVREKLEKRSLLPRMVYLSTQCVSASIKENIEANGSECGSIFSLEMKSLLERYVKILGCSLDEAVKVLLDVAEGQRPLEVCILYSCPFLFIIRRWLVLTLSLSLRKPSGTLIHF